MESKNIGSLHVNITGDDSDLQKALENSEKELNKATESVREFGTNIGVLRAEYKKLSKESFAGKTPQEIEAIERRLASLRDEIDDYGARIKSLSADPFQKGAEAVQQLSTMLAGAAGAATLFGGSEEELNQLMQKTIALIAIAEAAQTAADFTKQNAIGIFIKEKYAEIAARIREGLTIKANTAATVAETGAKTGLTVVQKVLIALQTAWNRAMAVSPIFLLIAAIAAVATGVLLLTRYFKDNNEELERQNKLYEKQMNYLDSIDSYHKSKVRESKARGKSEIEIIEEEIEYTKQRIDLYRNESDEITKLLKAREGSAKERVKEYGSLHNYALALGEVIKKYGSIENAQKASEVLNERFAESVVDYLDLLEDKRIAEIEAAENEIKLTEKRIEAQKVLMQNLRAATNQIHSKAYSDMLDRNAKEAQAYWNLQNEKLKTLTDFATQEKEVSDWLTEEEQKNILKRKKFQDEVSEVISKSVESGLEDLTVAFAESAGLLASGQTDMQGVFKSIGGVIANFMSSLGKALIATGIASEAFKKTLKNPYAAIAAGAALVALSSIVASKLQAGPSGGASYASTSTSASSGGVSDSGISYRTIFANDNQIKLVGELRAEGSVLVASLYNENKRITN